MENPPPDWTPLGYAVGGITIAGILRWIAKRLLMVSPTRAALKQLTADQREFHDRIMADVRAMHDAIAAVAGHQEADGARIAGLTQQLRDLTTAGHEGR